MDRALVSGSLTEHRPIYAGVHITFLASYSDEYQEKVFSTHFTHTSVSIITSEAMKLTLTKE